MPVPLPIETGRLLVRPFAPAADAGAMARVYSAPAAMRFIPGGALPDLVAVRRLLAGYERAQAARLGFGSWALVERATGAPVGDVGFGVFELTGDVELGYALACDRRGRGYGTEAAGASLTAALARLEVPRIVAAVDVENGASLRVPRRIGTTLLDEVEAYGRPHLLVGASRGSRPPPAPRARPAPATRRARREPPEIFLD